MPKYHAQAETDSLLWQRQISVAKSPFARVNRKTPLFRSSLRTSRSFCLMFLPLRGNVFMTTDIAK